MIGDVEGLVARMRRDDGRIVLCAPAVGLWREPPAKGAMVTSGALIGRIEVLGRLHDLRAPDGAYGLVVTVGGDASRARRAVDFDQLLLTLDPEMASATAAEPSQAGTASREDGALFFVSPSHGRFYAKASPDKPPFVSAGDVIARGQTVALLEVMKTFNRVQYGGSGLPEKARVLRVVPADGDDLAVGDPILELEPVR